MEITGYKHPLLLLLLLLLSFLLLPLCKTNGCKKREGIQKWKMKHTTHIMFSKFWFVDEMNSWMYSWIVILNVNTSQTRKHLNEPSFSGFCVRFSFVNDLLPYSFGIYESFFSYFFSQFFCSFGRFFLCIPFIQSNEWMNDKCKHSIHSFDDSFREKFFVINDINDIG